MENQKEKREAFYPSTKDYANIMHTILIPFSLLTAWGSRKRSHDQTINGHCTLHMAGAHPIFDYIQSHQTIH